MDLLMNILLNVFEFLGITHANQIVIFIVLMGFGIMYKMHEMARWVIAVFLIIMGVSLSTAIYQIVFNARAQCVYAYEETQPVIPHSSQRALTWAEIRDLNCPSLWVARNEIFYREGYCFFSPVGYSYFENGGRKCNHEVEKPASNVAWANAKMLGRLERRKGCQVPPSKCSSFSRVPSSKLIVSRPPLKSD